MHTVDTVLLIILTSFIGLFFFILIVIAIFVLRLVFKLKKITHKAEEFVDSATSAADVLKDAKGRFALYKLIANIVKMSNNKRR